MGTIYNQENELFSIWEKQYKKNGIENFCRDGLIFNGNLTTDAKNSLPGNQEEVLKNAKRKVLFFMKEPNGNPNEDYREWNLTGYSKNSFFRFIYAWLNGLSSIKAYGQYQPFKNERDLNLPLIIVNAKKQAGSRKADNNEVYKFALLYKSYLRAQFDIYSPNIIVCGGGPIYKKEVKMLSIIRKVVYNDIEFTQMDGSDWIWYNIERKIVLINSYHPSATKPDINKYNMMMEHFQVFLKKNIFSL